MYFICCLMVNYICELSVYVFYLSFSKDNVHAKENYIVKNRLPPIGRYIGVSLAKNKLRKVAFSCEKL